MQHVHLIFKLVIVIIFTLSLVGNLQSCKQNHNLESQMQHIQVENEVQKKPPSYYNDTIIIRDNAAVFYGPDSLQLQVIKSVTDSNIFDGMQHEYFYQMRNAHKILKENWPKIKIIDVQNLRYLTFLKSDGTSVTIDLNLYGDAYGLLIFNTKKSPELVDMTNLENALYNHFSH